MQAGRIEFMNDIITLAIQIARDGHSGQFRRDGVTPYIKHPEAVAARVGDDPIAIAAAWLHDILEDTPWTTEDLRKRGIPEEVIEVVFLLTKERCVNYTEYLGFIAAHPIARKVKIADMLANLSDNPTDRQIEKYANGLLYLMQNK